MAIVGREDRHLNPTVTTVFCPCQSTEYYFPIRETDQNGTLGGGSHFWEIVKYKGRWYLYDV